MSLWRKDFPAIFQEVHDQPLAYLDSGASSLKPQLVIDRLNQHYSKETANVHRGIHFLSSQGTTYYEEAREKIKTFVGASSIEEIIFTKGTTESINLVAETLGRFLLKKGDQVLIPTFEHHSNIVPWQIICEKVGAQVVEVPITDEGRIDRNSLSKLFSERTKILAITHASNTLGTVVPIKEIIQEARTHGVVVSVDGAQAAPHMKIDVADLDADFYSFSGHKIFGPTGIGILYGKKEWLEKLSPYQGGGAMIKEVSFEGTTFNDLPEKFEAGTPHIAGAIGLGSAVDYFNAQKYAEMEKHELELMSYAQEELLKIQGLRIIGPLDNKVSVISFFIDGTHPHDIGMILDQKGVAVRTGHHCTQPLMNRFGIPATVRASIAIYNGLQDIESLIEATKKAKEMLC